MPDSINNFSNKYEIVHKKNNFACLIFLILVLFLALIAASSSLFYFLKYGPVLPTQIGLNNSQVKDKTKENELYAKLEDYNCRDESQYGNILNPTIDLNAYERTDFYNMNVNKGLVLDKISKNEILLTELILWDDDSSDSLIHNGRALVCIKGKNKMGTVFFTTNNATLKYPVRYKDPEKNISNVLIQAIYIVPSGSVAKVDWKDKIQKNLSNIQAAQKRIFDGKSNIDFRIYPDIVYDKEIDSAFLTKIAQGIVTKDKNNEIALKPVNFLNKNIYLSSNTDKYPTFIANDQDLKKYSQVSTLVYFEVGTANSRSSQSRGNESGYAFTSPALDNGNYFGIIGTNLSRDISLESSSYHEFMHTLGLPDEYPYKDGSIQRTPTRIFKGQKQNAATLMQDPSQLNLKNTYIDDEERVLMGIKD